jgi:hypothetical protein
LTLDLSFNPRHDLVTHAFYTRQWIKSEQAGSQTFSTPDWTARARDTFDTLGAGIKWKIVPERLELGLDYVYATSEGSLDVESDLVDLGTLPDFGTRRHTLDIHATYRLRRDLDLRLGYLYERYRSDDWTLDGVAPDTIQNVLSLGELAPNYSVSVYSAALRMRF